MIKIGLVPTDDVIEIAKTFSEHVNSVQSKFKFIVYSSLEKHNELVPLKEIEDEKAFELIDQLKTKRYNLSNHDSLIVFTNAVLSASKEGLTNLFWSLYGKTSITSLKFLEWDIVKGELTQELKFHVVAHLLVALLIVTYTKLSTHEETRGCLMDFCNNLHDFNAMLARKYYICNQECQSKLKESPLKDTIAKILNQLRRKDNYSKSVLVIGSYKTNDSNKRLEQIKGKLSDLGYQAFFAKDIPDSYHGSRERKFVNLGSQSHFIICENSFASGHIDELRKCVENEFTTCVLQEINRSGTSMQVHYHLLHTYINVFCYGNGSNVNPLICTHLSPNLDSCLELAARWAEDFSRRMEEFYAKMNPGGEIL